MPVEGDLMESDNIITNTEKTNYELYHSPAVIHLRGSFRGKKHAYWSITSLGCICMVILNNVGLNRHQYVVYFFCLAGVEAN